MFTRAVFACILFAALLSAITGCKETVYIARATRMPEETVGFARLIEPQVGVSRLQDEKFLRLNQKTVRVNVQGDKTIAAFKAVDPSAYLLVHEGDMAQFVKNTARLQALLRVLRARNPQLAAEIEKEIP
jgi:hypothetical protein